LLDDEDPTVPDHLRSVLGITAELEFELATDSPWPEDNDAREAHRDYLRSKAHLIDNWKAGCPSREELLSLARRAVVEMQPAHHQPYPWPRTIEEADDLIACLTLTRDLMQFRDTLGGKPTPAELAEREEGEIEEDETE
jgi:hypothetical protein